MSQVSLTEPDIDLGAFARERIEKGSKSFALAAKLFDPGTRRSAYMLYAWCRHCDDVVDAQELGFSSAPPTAQSRDDMQATVDRLRKQTTEALKGEATDPVFAALAEIAAQHDLPHKFPLELIEGFQMDADQNPFETLEDTLTYCYHVAGVVGVMMAIIMGVKPDDHATLTRACDLGLAFQLTNIARDIRDDAAAGRCYLPADWLAEAGISAEQLSDPAHAAQTFSVVDRMLAEADRYYASSVLGLSQLPFRSAWAVASAQRVYRQIGEDVRAAGPSAWNQRHVVSKSRKLGLVARAMGKAAVSRLGPLHTPPLRDGLWTYPGFRQPAP